MSITSPTATSPRSTDGDRNDPSRPAARTPPHISWRETKPSPKTTELWLTFLGVVLLAVVYSQSRDASLNLFRACTLATVLGAAYIVSRGFAKAGSHDDDVRTDSNAR
jgi:hypothetical protein